MEKTELKKITKQVLEHWEDNVERAYLREEIFIGPLSCSYCDNFITGNVLHCKGCPVFKDTGEKDCSNTPYEAVSNYYLENKIEACWDEYLYLLNVAYSQNLM